MAIPSVLSWWRLGDAGDARVERVTVEQTRTGERRGLDASAMVVPAAGDGGMAARFVAEHLAAVPVR
jgi:hypothetical protein